MRKTGMRIGVLVAVALGVATGAWANGYKILCVRSARATGMGEAFIAQADDPSAIAFNPAGLAQLEGDQVNIHATICNAYTEHTAPSGETTDMEDNWQTVPSVFVTTDMGRDDMAFGLGISLPNGLSSEWAEDSFARYVATYSELTVVDISPAFGMKATENVMIGGGIDFYYSEATLESMADMGLAAGAPGMMDVRRTLEGDGTAWGGNVGMIYRINNRHRAAVTYRLPYSIEYDADLTIAALGIQSDVTATFDFPEVVVLGYAFRPTEKWTIEFNADWTHWDAVDDIEIEVDSPVLPDSTMEQDLENTFAYKLGAQYEISRNLALRCGYIYNENATSEETWRPSLPDTEMHFVTAGVGYRMDRLTIDAALQLVYYEKRTIDNNVDGNELFSSSSIDGEYETFAPCLSLGATYRF